VPTPPRKCTSAVLSTEYDQESGGATGCLTQEDPIGLAGGLNLYGFAGGDPVNFSDPFGLCIWDGCVVEAMVIGMATFGGIRAIANLIGKRPVTENVAMDMARGSFAGFGGPLVGRTASALATREAGAGTAANLTVQFGRVANQVAHTFRHVDELGLNRGTVMTAVQQHLQTVASQLTPGKSLNQIVEVEGVRLQYTAYQLANGVVNVGRIHKVP
jgi:uncharacterized protein RhaS with RHS repeats